MITLFRSFNYSTTNTPKYFYMQHTLRDKHIALHCSIVILVGATVGLENRLHMHLQML